MRYVVLLTLLLASCTPGPMTEQDRANYRAAAIMFGEVPHFRSTQCMTVEGITNCQGW